MPLAKNRELIPISTPAHKHLKAVVAAMKKSGIPTSGTMIASELILSIPIPQPHVIEKKRRVIKAVEISTPMAAL